MMRLRIGERVDAITRFRSDFTSSAAGTDVAAYIELVIMPTALPRRALFLLRAS